MSTYAVSLVPTVIKRSARPGAAILAALLLTACASTPEPIGELASARTALRSVNNAEVRRLAPVQLDRASSKLERAQAAMKAENYAEARRLAEESLADAELARAQTNAILAQRNARELEQSIQVLRSEIDRARAID